MDHAPQEITRYIRCIDIWSQKFSRMLTPKLTVHYKSKRTTEKNNDNKHRTNEQQQRRTKDQVIINKQTCCLLTDGGADIDLLRGYLVFNFSCRSVICRNCKVCSRCRLRITLLRCITNTFNKLNIK